MKAVTHPFVAEWDKMSGFIELEQQLGLSAAYDIDLTFLAIVISSVLMMISSLALALLLRDGRHKVIFYTLLVSMALVAIIQMACGSLLFVSADTFVFYDLCTNLLIFCCLCSYLIATMIKFFVQMKAVILLTPVS